MAELDSPDEAHIAFRVVVDEKDSGVE